MRDFSINFNIKSIMCIILRDASLPSSMYNECDREFLKKEKTPLTNECTASLSFSSSYIINLPYVGLKANSMSF